MTALAPELTPTPNAAPSWRFVLAEQVRTVGLALRREGVVTAVLLGLITIVALLDAFEDGSTLDFPTDASFVLPLLGLAAPFAVWKGERLFGNSHLWTLPVDRRQHAVLKVLAGSVWLYAAALAIVAWLALLATVTGGVVFGPYDRLIVEGAETAENLRMVRWTPPLWQWLSILTGTTVAYMLSSALVLGVRYPLRWVAGALLALAFCAAVSEHAAESILQVLLVGPLGVDNVLSGGTERLDTAVRLANGDFVVAWRGLPTIGPWATATAFWFALASAALWLAAWRHRER